MHKIAKISPRFERISWIVEMRQVLPSRFPSHMFDLAGSVYFSSVRAGRTVTGGDVFWSTRGKNGTTNIADLQDFALLTDIYNRKHKNVTSPAVIDLTQAYLSRVALEDGLLVTGSSLFMSSEKWWQVEHFTEVSKTFHLSVDCRLSDIIRIFVNSSQIQET